MPILFQLLVFSTATALPAALPKIGPHQGMVAADGDSIVELVVGPEQIALYQLDATLKGLPPTAGNKLTLFCAGHPPLELQPGKERYDAANPYGAASAMALAVVLQNGAGAKAFRFDYSPENATSFHDHRPFHGGMVGMIGDRHLELAVAPAGAQEELQLYVTDAYRRPISLEGLKASATIGDGKPFPLTASSDCFVGRVAKSKGPLDIHAEIAFPSEPEPLSMDFYVESGPKPVADHGGVIEVRVGTAGFSPARIEAAANKPVRLRFLRTTEGTCGKQVVFPALGITRDLPLDKPVDVDVVAPRGELAFTCGMRMLKGSVVGL